MAAARRPLVAGNWKMNGLRASAAELDRIIAGFEPALAARIDLLVCPPATLIAQFAERSKGTPVLIGAQDCHFEASGAHTGDLSAEMLRDAGATAVIVGHSERRTGHGESDALVRAKAEAVLRAGLMAIVCIGESRAERDAGHTLEIARRQLADSVPQGAAPQRLVVAYEPVWAIGSGSTPAPRDITAVHEFIREELASRFGMAARLTRILYGGSVKAENASALLRSAEVDGALVGGASLKAAELLAISRAYL